MSRLEDIIESVERTHWHRWKTAHLALENHNAMIGQGRYFLDTASATDWHLVYAFTPFGEEHVCALHPHDRTVLVEPGAYKCHDKAISLLGLLGWEIMTEGDR